MKTLITSMAALFAVTMTGQLQAAQVTVTSPDQAQTQSDSSILSRGLHWDERDHALSAVITYSNLNYVSDLESRKDDTFRFMLPGVQFDSAKNIFYVESRNGQRTPIAKFRTLLFGKKIQLLPGATVYATKEYGKISVKLMVAPEPTSAPHWIELNE
jgi:hypothetical protein